MEPINQTTPPPTRTFRSIFMILLIAVLISASATAYLLYSMSRPTSTLTDNTSPAHENPFNETAQINPFTQTSTDTVNPFEETNDTTNPFDAFEDETTTVTGDYENPF